MPRSWRSPGLMPIAASISRSRCWEVKSPSEMVELWTAYARKQFEALTGQTKELAEQTKELAALGQKLAIKNAKPVTGGVTKIRPRKLATSIRGRSEARVHSPGLHVLPGPGGGLQARSFICFLGKSPRMAGRSAKIQSRAG